MSNSFPNPWAEVILEQMWIVRQTTSLVARSIDAELMCDPQALTDYCLNPSAKRLNPLEFHGKRRAPPAQRPQSGNPENTASHAKEGQQGQKRPLSASYAGVDRQGRRKS